MKREELIAYDKWLMKRKWEKRDIISPEKAADLYLAEHPLPPAEGAEEILRNTKIQDASVPSVPLSWLIAPESPTWNAVLAAMQDFAALHAQKIADKMVSERLRGVTERCKKLEFMIDKGLGWDDMKNDITMPHEL